MNRLGSSVKRWLGRGLLWGCVLGSGLAQAQDTAAAAYKAGRDASDGATRARCFARGMALAQARLDRDPDDAEGLYWLAVNLGAHALERGKLSALPALPRMEALLLHLDRVAPDYESAGAARVLGRLYHKAPPIISIGSNKEARRFLERAVGLAPDHPGNLAFAADFLAGHGERARATTYASRCLGLLAGKQLSVEQREWVGLASRVLEANR